MLQVLVSANLRRHTSRAVAAWRQCRIPSVLRFPRNPPLQIHASSCETSGVLLAVLLVNSTSCSWLQCGLVCVVLLNCCLATFILEPSWLLLSTIPNLLPSSSVQGVGNEFPLRIDVGIWRSIVKEFRKANGEQFGNLLWTQLLDIKSTLHWFTSVVVCAETCADLGCDKEVVGVDVGVKCLKCSYVNHLSQHDQSGF